jgi:hypothetical protein
MGISEQQIAKAKAEHADTTLYLYTVGEDQVVMKTPPPAEWTRFRTMYMDAAQRPRAMHALVYGCLVCPSAAEFGQMLERRPALCEVFGEKLSTAAGLGAEVEEKKL